MSKCNIKINLIQEIKPDGVPDRILKTLEMGNAGRYRVPVTDPLVPLTFEFERDPDDPTPLRDGVVAAASAYVKHYRYCLLEGLDPDMYAFGTNESYTQNKDGGLDLACVNVIARVGKPFLSDDTELVEMYRAFFMAMEGRDLIGREMLYDTPKDLVKKWQNRKTHLIKGKHNVEWPVEYYCAMLNIDRGIRRRMNDPVVKAGLAMRRSHRGY